MSPNDGNAEWWLTCDPKFTEIASRISDELREGSDCSYKVKQVREHFLQGQFSTVNALRILDHESEGDWSSVGCCLLRHQIDGFLQALYIFESAATLEERVSQYLGYGAIEHYNYLETIQKSQFEWAGQMRRDQEKFNVQAERVKKAYHAALPAYKTKKGGAHQNWYCGNLRDLAIRIDMEELYEKVNAQLNKAMHITPMDMKVGPVIRSKFTVLWGWAFLFRLLTQLASVFHIEIVPSDQELIDTLASPWQGE